MNRYFLAILFLTGCSLEANIDKALSGLLESEQSKIPALTGAETVVTSNGITVNAVFGEISSKQVLSNDIEIEGVFYE